MGFCACPDGQSPTEFGLPLGVTTSSEHPNVNKSTSTAKCSFKLQPTTFPPFLWRARRSRIHGACRHRHGSERDQILRNPRTSNRSEAVENVSVSIIEESWTRPQCIRFTRSPGESNSTQPLLSTTPRLHPIPNIGCTVFGSPSVCSSDFQDLAVLHSRKSIANEGRFSGPLVRRIQWFRSYITAPTQAERTTF